MASILDKLVGEYGEKSGWNNAFLHNLDMKGRWTGDVTSDPYTKSDLVYTCVSTTARAISQVPLVVYQRKSLDSKELEPVSQDHPWQKLLDNPNPIQTATQFVQAIIGFYMLEGNAWIIRWPTDSSKIPPEAIFVVSVRNIEPILDKSTGQLQGWMYYPGGRPDKRKGGGRQQTSKGFRLSVEDVVHFATWNPNDPIMGLRPSDPASVHIKSDYKSSVYNEVFFENSAVPAGIISAPKDSHVTDEQMERLRAQIEARHRGFRRAWRLLFLRRGLTFQQIASSHKDMDFINLRKMSRESIMQIFGMKKAVISVLEDVNLATAREQKRSWWEDTNLPMMRMITDGLNRTWISRLSGGRLRVEFDVSIVSALKESYTEKVENAFKLWQIGFTANQINQRLKLGFESVPWGDVWWTDMNKMPVSSSAPPPISPTSPERQGEGGDKEDDKKKPPKEEEEDDGKGLEEEDVEIHLDAVSEAEKSIEEKKAASMWKSVIGKSSELEEAFRKKVQRLFYEMRQKSVRYLLKHGDIHGLLREEFVEDRRNLQKWTSRLYLKTYRLGLETINSKLDEIKEEAQRNAKWAVLKDVDLGIDIDFEMASNPEVISYIGDQIYRITGIVDTVKERIRTQLAEALRNGESLEEMADRVKREFQMATTRAKTIARTEISGTLNHARSSGLARSGFTKKKWVTALDEKVRHTHRAMEGKVIDSDKSWHLPSGAVLRYPGDYSAGFPRETINCRCLEDPVVESHPAFNEPEEPFPSAPQVMSDPEEDLVKELLHSAQTETNPAKMVQAVQEYLQKRFGVHMNGGLLANESSALRDVLSAGTIAPGTAKAATEHLGRVKYLAETLASLSDDQVAYIKRSPIKHITWYDRDFDGDTWEISRYSGYVNWKDSIEKIHLNPRCLSDKRWKSYDTLKDTLFHEVAHLYNYRQILHGSSDGSRDLKIDFYRSAFSAIAVDSNESPLYKRTRKNPYTRTIFFPSKYSKTNQLEYFAEMVAYRMRNPMLFEQWWKNALATIELYERYGRIPDSAAKLLRERFTKNVDFVNMVVDGKYIGK